MALGYTQREARDAVMKAGIDFSKVKGVEDVIKLSLKGLS